MASEYGLEIVRKSKKDTCLKLYEKKSDEELQQILRHNALAIMHQNEVDGAATLGESDACSELLQRRKEQQERIDSEIDAFDHCVSSWSAEYEFRVENAVLNLPVATSYYGQLVAAILEEEDGLKESEIAEYSTELSEMNNDQYSRILRELVSEGIVALDKDHRYWLLSICDETLMLTDPVKWAQKIVAYKAPIPKLTEEQLIFLRRLATNLEVNKEPLTEFDWYDILDNRYRLTPIEDDLERLSRIFKSKYISKFSNRFGSRDFRLKELDELVEAGILKRYYLTGKKWGIYYYPLLGEVNDL